MFSKASSTAASHHAWPRRVRPHPLPLPHTGPRPSLQLFPALPAVTMPIDVVKTRLQMDGAGGVKAYKGAVDCATQLVKAEGPGSLFKGLPPALLRQSTYGSLRYGLYGPIRNSLGARAKTEGPAAGAPLPARMRSQTSRGPPPLTRTDVLATARSRPRPSARVRQVLRRALPSTRSRCTRRSWRARARAPCPPRWPTRPIWSKSACKRTAR